MNNDDLNLLAEKLNEVYRELSILRSMIYARDGVLPSIFKGAAEAYGAGVNVYADGLPKLLDDMDKAIVEKVDQAIKEKLSDK